MSKQLLDHIAKHIALTSAEESMLLSKVTQRRYLKHQYVVQQGDVCKHLNFVISGCLKSFHIDHEGNEHIIRFALENWWVMDLGSFISQSPAEYNIQCLEATELMQISTDDFSSLLIEIPKLERFFRLIFQTAFVHSEKRVIFNFSLSAKDRYVVFRDQYPEIEQRVPQYMIASYLGITKEFLSKIRNQLAHEF